MKFNITKKTLNSLFWSFLFLSFTSDLSLVFHFWKSCLEQSKYFVGPNQPPDTRIWFITPWNKSIWAGITNVWQAMFVCVFVCFVCVCVCVCLYQHICIDYECARMRMWWFRQEAVLFVWQRCAFSAEIITIQMCRLQFYCFVPKIRKDIQLININSNSTRFNTK